MHLKEIDLYQECKDLPEVISSKVYEGGKLSPTGLFSQQIFGPIKSYYCACVKDNYYGKSSGISKCPTCNVDITSSEERRKRFAKIVLPFPILNPLYYYILTQSKPTIKRILLSLITSKNRYYFDEEGKLNKLTVNDDNPENVEVLEGLQGIIKVINNLIENNPDDPGLAYIKENEHNLLINYVLVIPPEFRPNHRNENNVNISDEINQYYSLLLVRCNYIKSNPLTIDPTGEMYKNNFKFIQLHVIKLYDFVLSKLSKKEGLLRKNILGKRVDFSGRAVISPDPTLNLDECRIPYVMILEIMKPQLVSYLVERRVCKWYNIANKLVEDCIKKEDYYLMDMVTDFCKGKVCVLNRQPTLHRLSVLGFKVLPHTGKTIQIHPMICSSFNADFDGDCLEGQISLTMTVNELDKEIVVKMSELESSGYFKFKSEKVKDDGRHIKKYAPIHKMRIKAIDPDTGKCELKNISEYSVHENLEMFKVHDPQSRFKDFWTSYDHSLIIFDEVNNQIKKISPSELLSSPQGKYIIQGEVIKNEHSRTTSED